MTKPVNSADIAASTRRHEEWFRRRRSAIVSVPIVATALFVGHTAVFAEPSPDDAVIAMCLDAGKPLAVCTCASESLFKELGKGSYASYERVGEIYLKELLAGNARAEAWSIGLGIEKLDLETANFFGRNHRSFIELCGG